jgi:tRNA-dihydrouridine synthase
VKPLPWKTDTIPLMLAPMQGLTNRGLRTLFIDLVRPDVVFTEFIQVKQVGRNVISRNDRLEVQETRDDVPLVVQLIGAETESLLAAAELVQELGAKHVNINLGCPYGRMGNKAAGGALLQNPVKLEKILQTLRPRIYGSFSLKVRAGFQEPAELYNLLPLFEHCGIDYLIVHARTVAQRYSGVARHTITAEVVKRTSLPVIANGDIYYTDDGLRVLEQTRASGLMLARGAISDPFLFKRLRGRHPPTSTTTDRGTELHLYLQELISEYQHLFCGEQQVLAKTKEVLAFIPEPEYKKLIRQLRKAQSITQFLDRLDTFLGG